MVMSRPWGWAALFLPVGACAQGDTLPFPNTVHGHRAIIEVDAEWGSSALTNDLAWGLFTGQRLSTELRLAGSKEVRGNNRAGACFSARGSLAWGQGFLGQERLMPRISMGHQYLLGIEFARDAYELAFLGNAGFEDRTAHAGPARFVAISYQQLGFGVEDRRTGSYAELGVVNGHAFSNGRIHKADLYTAPDGRYLELDLDGEYHRSDTGSTRLNKGTGAAAALHWRHRVKVAGTHAMLSLTATDLGFIAWNGNSLSAGKNGTIRYDGLTVAGIPGLEDLALDKGRVQDSLGLGYHTGSVLQWLPAKLQARLEFGRMVRLWPGQVFHAYSLSVDHWFVPGYRPRALAQGRLFLTRAFHAEAGLGYGGFSGLRAVAGTGTCVGKHLYVGIRSTHFIGVLSGQARGMALAGSLEATW